MNRDLAGRHQQRSCCSCFLARAIFASLAVLSGSLGTLQAESATPAKGRSIETLQAMAPLPTSVPLPAASAAAPVAATGAVFTPVAEAFDFPVGKPNATGYYKARGFQCHGHLGEDWNGTGGGDSDAGDSVHAIGNGVVVFARDVQLGWGNVVIVRHAFYESGQLRQIDSLYGHLDSIFVQEGQTVARGVRLGTIGSNRGMYHAHLHFEIRHNLAIGMNRAAFPRDFSSYHDPTEFIRARRVLPSPSAAEKSVLVATNTFSKQPADYSAPADGFGPQLAGNGAARQRAAGSGSAPGVVAASRQKNGRLANRRTGFRVDRFGDLRTQFLSF